MDVICKEKYNVIFWRNNSDEDWSCEDLDTMINAYQTEAYTDLEYWQPVRRDGTDEILYHVFFCQSCGQPILAVDANHEYKYCPHCGRAIWRD